MSVSRKTSIAAVVAVAASCLLCGCFTAPATRFYLLAPVAEREPSPTHAAKPVTVVIKDIRLPLYLDRPQIITRDSGSRLEFSEIEQWGGLLREDLARVLATNLGRLLEGDRVVAAPYPLTVPPDYRVEVDIRSFERQSGGRVELSAQWWITRGPDGTLLVSSEGAFFGDPLATGVSYDALVNSMSAVYGELARAIARSIRPGGGS